jgi:polar amino acid transport system substrate-binding protein
VRLTITGLMGDAVFGMRRSPPLRQVLVSAVLLASLAACDDPGFPRDPDGTLESVLDTGQMTVAVAHHPPWVITDGDRPSGAEVALIEEFADELGVTVAWRPVAAFTALEGLEQGEIDLG